MQRKLRRVVSNEKYYFKDGVRFDGVHENIRGDVSGISGDMTGIWGDVSGIRGCMTGISGDITGVRGDIDACGISNDERSNGIDIEDLLEIS